MLFQSPADFEEPLLSILGQLGGKARLVEIYEQFALRYPTVVKESYWNEAVDNDSRWHDYINRCRWQVLKPKGLLKKGSKKGTWELA